MKLLYCEVCDSVFNLSDHLKTCECGQVKGLYVNQVEAKVNGEGYSLAIGNGSFFTALRDISRMKDDPRNSRKDPWEAGIGSMIAWARPHEGPANPHTTVDPELGGI